MKLESLIGQRVHYAILCWSDNGYKPLSFFATVGGVDGTMLYMKFQKTYPGDEEIEDCWMNTSGFLFTFVKPI